MRHLHLASLLLLLLTLLCAATRPAFGQFGKPTMYAVGEEPEVVVTADFNNDGIPDLATADFTSEDVSILLGNGDGTFQAARKFSTALGPSSLAVGDFNGDGNLDIAVTEYGTNSSELAIFLGNGDGTFAAGPVYSAFEDPYSVTTADFNGDGNLDLAIANNAANNVIVMYGSGDGTFKETHAYKVPEPERVLAVDLNGDGYPDLAVLAYCGKDVQTCTSGAVAVLLNQGSGTFKAAKYFSVGGVGPDGIAAADLRQDGNIDLVVANNNFEQPSTISVLLGKGNGTFQPAVHYNVGAGPAGIAIADFNGNGKLDLAVANTAGETLSILAGNGDGTFQSAKNIPFTGDPLPISVVAGDFTSASTPDLAVALCYGNEVAIFLNTN
jgi:hypothetical protein